MVIIQMKIQVSIQNITSGAVQKVQRLSDARRRLEGSLRLGQQLSALSSCFHVPPSGSNLVPTVNRGVHEERDQETIACDRVSLPHPLGVPYITRGLNG